MFSVKGGASYYRPRPRPGPGPGHSHPEETRGLPSLLQLPDLHSPRQ